MNSQVIVEMSVKPFVQHLKCSTVLHTPQSVAKRTTLVSFSYMLVFHNEIMTTAKESADEGH